MYGNDKLVELVANSKSYLEIKSPRDKRILEVMRKVDRKEFLHDELLNLHVIDPKVLGALGIALNQIMEEDSTERKIITPYEASDPMKPYRIAIMCIPELLKRTRIIEVPVSALAYNDIPLPIGYDQSCSQPSLIGLMEDLLELREGHNVLEIGSGVGYHAAITLELIRESGKLTTIEIVPELADISKKNLEKCFGSLGSRIEVIKGDGSRGYHVNSPYDRIYLTAGVKMDHFDVRYFTDQLKKQDGIFLFPDSEAFNLITYKNGKVKEQRLGNVSFVELHGENY